MSLLRVLTRKITLAGSEQKWLTSGHSRYSTNRSWKNNRSTGWNYSRRRKGGHRAQPVIIISPIPRPLLLGSLPSHPLNNVYCQSACHVKLHWNIFKCVFLSGFGELAFQPQKGAASCGAASAAATTTQAAPGSAPSLGARGAPSAPLTWFAATGRSGWARDTTAAVLLPGPQALPLHHDGGSWESYCRTQRWLLFSRCPASSSLCSPNSSPPSLGRAGSLRPDPPSLSFTSLERGTWLQEEGGLEGTAGRGGGALGGTVASPPHARCSRLPVDSGPRRTHGRRDQRRGQVERNGMAERGSKLPHRAGPLRSLLPAPRFRLPPFGTAPRVYPVLLPNLGIWRTVKV